MIARQNGAAFLEQIIARKKIRLAVCKSAASQKTIESAVTGLKTAPFNFKNALKRKNGLSIIGEIKKASPSRGLIQPDFHPVRQALAYQRAGVAAISVLTEEDFFCGSSNDLRRVAAAVSIPVLRKDFIIDPYQIYEARLLGAAAVLLICAALNDQTLRQLLQLSRDLKLTALVEVHNLEELMRALAAGAEVIGINNRDLHSFHVDLSTTDRLAGLIPGDRIIVSESGIHNAQSMARVYRAGAQAVLIGEVLMRAAGNDAQVEQQIRALVQEIPQC